MSNPLDQFITEVNDLAAKAEEMKKSFFDQFEGAAEAPQPPSVEQKVAALQSAVAELKLAVGKAKEEEEEEEKAAKAKGAPFGGKQAPPFGDKDEEEEKASKAKAKEDEEEEEMKASKAKEEEDEEKAEKAKAKGEDDEEKAEKTSAHIPWPTDCASKDFLDNVKRASDPLRDWGRDPWA